METVVRRRKGEDGGWGLEDEERVGGGKGGGHSGPNQGVRLL